MKSAKFPFLSCLFGGIVLFIIGVVSMVNIRTAPPLPKNIAETPSVDSKNAIDLTENYTNSGNPINFLVLIKEASGDNTDSIIIANYMPVTNQISLLTIPRDTKPTRNGSYKINSIFSLGLSKYANLSKTQRKHKAAEYTAQAISNFTNIPIDYYVYLE
ncbi:MAG TPA: LCP family protein, partial [Ruminiclostridium sp.]|nr:LCP family protein [Ruminiclostridium sp.]